MSISLKNFCDNYTGNYYIVDVPHQLSACGYWVDSIDDANDSGDLHCQHICKTVTDLRVLTDANDPHRGGMRHQGGRIASLAESALKEICEEYEQARDEIASDPKSTLQQLVDAGCWTKIVENMQNSHDAYAFPEYIKNSDTSEYHVIEWLESGDIDGNCTYESLTVEWQEVLRTNEIA